MSYSGERVESRTAAVQTTTTGTEDKTITTLRDALGRTVEVDTSEHETFYTYDIESVLGDRPKCRSWSPGSETVLREHFKHKIKLDS